MAAENILDKTIDTLKENKGFDYLKENTDNLKEAISSRLKLPVLVSYGIILIIFHWDILYYLVFSKEDALHKIYMVKVIYKNEYYYKTWVPIGLAIVYTFLFPVFQVGINYVFKRFDKKNQEMIIEKLTQKAKGEFQIQSDRTGSQSLKELQDQIDSLTDAKNSLTDAKNSLTNARDRIAKENTNLNNQINKLFIQTTEFKSIINSKDITIAELHEDNSQKEVQIDTLKDILNHKEEDLIIIKDQISDIKNLYRNFLNEYENFEREIIGMNAEFKKFFQQFLLMTKHKRFTKIQEANSIEINENKSKFDNEDDYYEFTNRKNYVELLNILKNYSFVTEFENDYVLTDMGNLFLDAYKDKTFGTVS